ncbi:MAG: competence protein ComA [Caulobacterales bacterium 68-7]|nr:PaaI family thioesterase [Caulobacterales bacterium]OJU12335.1 MAG: competence protein ComA [Caulobacterales bacterium 68-7]
MSQVPTDKPTDPGVLAALAARNEGTLPGYMGIEWLHAEKGLMRGRIALKPHHMAPNGFLHAATVITLADTACGYGCFLAMPEGGVNFTTIELKSNFLGTAREGAIIAEAKLIHGGKSTQVWDATVTDETTNRPIALFRCTQMILRAKT